jgi:rubrerythrin
MAEAGVFSSHEIVEMAIQTEQSGYRFYEAAAGKVASTPVADLLTWLAAQEREHEQIFRTMQTESDRHMPTEEYEGERAEYVQALLDVRVLPDVETGLARLAAMKEDTEVVDFAIGFEKDTILFMYVMRDMSAPTAGETIDKLIAQEKGHVARLLQMKGQL